VVLNASNACEVVIDELISIDTFTGELPSLVDQMQQDGNKVVFAMYPHIAIGAEYGFDQCVEEFIDLEYRINQFAINTENFWLVRASNVVPTGDNSYFVDDLVHPSTKGTDSIGKYIAERIKSIGSTPPPDSLHSLDWRETPVPCQPSHQTV
jgi:lysophospholipase L1-like esterase